MENLASWIQFFLVGTLSVRNDRPTTTTASIVKKIELVDNRVCLLGSRRTPNSSSFSALLKHHGPEEIVVQKGGQEEEADSGNCVQMLVLWARKFS